MRTFRLGGDNELAALKADMRKRTARSLMRGDDNLHRVEHASGAQVNTDQRSGPPVAPSSPSAPSGPAVPAAPLPPAATDARPTPRGGGHLLVLPWPPTGNNAYPTGSDGRRHASTEVSRYRRHVAALCYGAGKVAGRYVLHVHLSPPDARARDMDNALKSIADALVRASWLPSDAMTYMRELHVTTDDARNGSAIVRAYPYQ